MNYRGVWPTGYIARVCTCGIITGLGWKLFLATYWFYVLADVKGPNDRTSSFLIRSWDQIYSQSFRFSSDQFISFLKSQLIIQRLPINSNSRWQRGGLGWGSDPYPWHNPRITFPILALKAQTGQNRSPVPFPTDRWAPGGRGGGKPASSWMVGVSQWVKA